MMFDIKLQIKNNIINQKYVKIYKKYVKYDII